MKIFLIIPSLVPGGAERVMSELANEFYNQNHDVHLVLLAESNDFYSINPLIPVHRLGFVNKNLISKLFSEARVLFLLRRLIKNERPNSVLSFMDKYNIFTLLACSFLRINVYISDRGNPKSRLPFYIRTLKRFLYKNASGIVAQTNLAKHLLSRYVNENKIRIIPNPVRNIKLYPEIKKEKIIINIGRLVPEKGQIYLLEAFAQTHNQEWELVILGDGPLREQLNIKAKMLNISNRVTMPGTVNNVDEWLARASIFVLSSISEGYPNALIEAMAAGLACISFDCNAGPRDIIINNTNGILVPIYDIKRLAREIDLLIENSNLRSKLSIEGMKIKEELNISKISKIYLDFLGLNKSNPRM